MEWTEFLEYIADAHCLSPEQRETFLIRLNDGNRDESEAKLASLLSIGEGAFKKRMSGVYEQFAQSCPELAVHNKRGKLEKLRACLRRKYKCSERMPLPQDETSASVPESVANNNTSIQPTAYENLSRKGIQPEQFKGRDRELIHLHHLLQQNAQVAITAAVVGMGGVGKTELAIQYAREHLSTYQGGVCWLPANDFASKLVEFARPHFFPTINLDKLSPVERVRYCWQHWAKGEVLLIVDDVTNYKQQVYPYLPESHRFKVLITTREHLGKPIVRLDLKVLELDQALDLLKFLLGNERVEQELDAAAELCKDLGYLPLGLELVGRYLADEPISIAQMLKRLQRKRIRHPALIEPDQMMTAQLGVADAFELSWERLDENAQQLGYLLSLFALAPIPWELVEGVYKFWQGKEFDLEDLEKSRRDLIKLSLLNREHTTYSLHPLIRNYFKDKLEEIESADEIKEGLCRVMAGVAKQIPESNALTRSDIVACSPAIPHLETVANDLNAYIRDEDLTETFSRLGCFYQGQAFYEKAEYWWQQCLTITKSRFGSEHLYVAESLNNLAYYYRAKGQYSDAVPLLLQALGIYEISLGEKHIDIAKCLNHIGHCYHCLRSYSEAEYFLNKSVEIWRLLSIKHHPDLTKSLNNLALLYIDKESYIEAKRLLEQALDMNKCLLGYKHPEIAIILNNLGKISSIKNEFKKAELLYLTAFKIYNIAGIKEHPDVAITLNELAILYDKQDNCIKAKNYYQKSLDINQIVLGKNQPDVAIILNNLAKLYTKEGRNREAGKLYTQALEICEQRLPNDHPNTLKIRENLEYCCSKMEK